jgi:putative ABC transport system ATP-binding protein
MSAEENVYLAGQLAGLSMSEIRKRSDHLFNIMQIGDLRKHMPSELSGGQQQRFAISRALINNPKILLADEPTGDLDSKTTAEVLSVLYQLNEGGQTTIMVTHDPSQAKPGGRVIKISDGQII